VRVSEPRRSKPKKRKTAPPVPALGAQPVAAALLDVVDCSGHILCTSRLWVGTIVAATIQPPRHPPRHPTAGVFSSARANGRRRE
jgi:hypothetical protein